MSVIDNKAANRYELVEEGQTAFANYRRSNGEVAITHVESPLALRGKGTAGRLMQGIVDLTTEAGEKIVPICPYAVHWLSRRQGQ